MPSSLEIEPEVIFDVWPWENRGIKMDWGGNRFSRFCDVRISFREYLDENQFRAIVLDFKCKPILRDLDFKCTFRTRCMIVSRTGDSGLVYDKFCADVDIKNRIPVGDEINGGILEIPEKYFTDDYSIIIVATDVKIELGCDCYCLSCRDISKIVRVSRMIHRGESCCACYAHWVPCEPCGCAREIAFGVPWEPVRRRIRHKDDEMICDEDVSSDSG